MSEATKWRASRAAMAFAALGAALVAVQPVQAAGEETRIVLRNVDTQPASDAEARTLLRRIDVAAMEACGASEFSLPEMKYAVRNSQCWRDARARAVSQIGDPRVAALVEDQGSL